MRTPDAFVAEVGGGLAAFTEPGSPLNKVVGLGFAPFDEAAWVGVEAELLRRGPVQVELSTLADPSIGRFLTARGHRLAFAAQAGCELAVVTTQPGSKSQQNMHRRGFVLLYSRNVLVREPG